MLSPSDSPKAESEGFAFALAGGAPGFCFTAKCTLYGLREKNGEILRARKRPQDDTLSGYAIRET